MVLTRVYTNDQFAKNGSYCKFRKLDHSNDLQIL